MSDNKDFPQAELNDITPTKPSRREFLKLAGKAAVGAAASWAGYTTKGWPITQAAEAIAPGYFKKPELKSGQVPQPTESVQNPEENKKELLNTILSLPLNSPERREKEKTLFEQAVNLEDIDQALSVIHYYGNDQDNNWHLRAKLIQKRFTLRQDGKSPELTRVTEEQISWAEKNEIHPEILGIAFDAQAKAKRVIQKQLDKSRERFRPDLVREINWGNLPKDTLKNLKTEDILMPAGALAELIRSESGAGFQWQSPIDGKLKIVGVGFANYGMYPALSQINADSATKGFPTAKEDLKNLSLLVSNLTGLNFVPDNIPGSTWIKGTESGGAYGGFIPSVLANVNKLFEEAGETLNWTDITNLASAMYVRMAMGEQFIEKYENNKPVPGYRYGYLKGDFRKDNRDIGYLIREASVKKWNGDANQVAGILNAAASFTQTFPQVA